MTRENDVQKAVEELLPDVDDSRTDQKPPQTIDAEPSHSDNDAR